MTWCFDKSLWIEAGCKGEFHENKNYFLYIIITNNHELQPNEEDYKSDIV